MEAAAAAAAAALQTLLSAAQCPICCSVFNTPLILKSCGHSCEWLQPGGACFCTLCCMLPPRLALSPFP